MKSNNDWIVPLGEISLTGNIDDKDEFLTSEFCKLNLLAIVIFGREGEKGLVGGTEGFLFIILEE